MVVRTHAAPAAPVRTHAAPAAPVRSSSVHMREPPLAAGGIRSDGLSLMADRCFITSHFLFYLVIAKYKAHAYSCTRTRT